MCFGLTQPNEQRLNSDGWNPRPVRRVRTRQRQDGTLTSSGIKRQGQIRCKMAERILREGREKKGKEELGYRIERTENSRKE